MKSLKLKNWNLTKLWTWTSDYDIELILPFQGPRHVIKADMKVTLTIRLLSNCNRLPLQGFCIWNWISNQSYISQVLKSLTINFGSYNWCHLFSIFWPQNLDVVILQNWHFSHFFLIQLFVRTPSEMYKSSNSNAGQKPAEGWFLSKWVYNFLPAKDLCTYQDIIHSNIT